MKRSTTTLVAGLLLAGGVMLAETREAEAQCYSGGYVSSYSYAYTPSYVVTPAPVVVQPMPVYRTYYHARPYYSHGYVRHHHGYHRHYGHRPRGFSFGFGYYR